MAGGGFSRLPNGRVVVALTVPRPAAEGGTVRVLVHAENRARALTRLRNLGLRAVYLRGNAEPPTPDEVTAVLHHPEGLLWRATPQCPSDADALWRPIRALLRPGRAWQPSPARPGLARRPMVPWRHTPPVPRVRTSG
jgi:hypothetical protein